MTQDIAEVRDIIWDYYRTHQRDLPWRKPPFNAYHILVSEMMLQQTQVSRVIPKYQTFLHTFPTMESLVVAPLNQVMSLWSGLGYNRRAKYLHDAAKALYTLPEPWSVEDLQACKGIGYNTAAAVCVYAYDQAIPFIETNVRTILIYHFFPNIEAVHDKELETYNTALFDTEMPREWCWALMDYGTYIKQAVGNTSRQSKHYAKQASFEGSVRQLRGRVIKLVTNRPMTFQELNQDITDKRLSVVLDGLVKEGLVQFQDDTYRI